MLEFIAGTLFGAFVCWTVMRKAANQHYHQGPDLPAMNSFRDHMKNRPGGLE